MAIPVLYWMLECAECGSRLVVRDCYLQSVGTSDSHPTLGAGYGGVPLPERHKCTKGCIGTVKAVGSIFNTDDQTMWLHEPHLPITMTRTQRREWQRLIHEAGYAGNQAVQFVPRRRTWWKFWGARQP